MWHAQSQASTFKIWGIWSSYNFRLRWAQISGISERQKKRSDKLHRWLPHRRKPTATCQTGLRGRLTGRVPTLQCTGYPPRLALLQGEAGMGPWGMHRQMKRYDKGTSPQRVTCPQIISYADPAFTSRLWNFKGIYLPFMDIIDLGYVWDCKLSVSQLVCKLKV